MTARNIPSIDVLLRRPAMAARVAADGRVLVVDALRTAADAWRALPPADGNAAEPAPWIVARALEALDGAQAPSLRRVINATGVLIHTNLGRAPLARQAIAAAADVASGYCNLEYELDTGTRGHRHVHAERLVCALTGAEGAVITNNNAAATWLVLAALGAGREVVVSRGELVEIGGGFRVPEIMAQSGATLREVGTTNRTRASDYGAAISDRTALLLRVHPSNFRIEGFTERPDLAELAGLAHQFHLPLFEDLGSGWLGLPQEGGWPDAIRDEPSVRDSLKAGADLVAFSGDKLLGGPQAGIIVGRRALVERVRRHPLMRAVRADKQTYAALEATLGLWQREAARTEIPVVRMLLERLESLEARARALVQTTSEVVSAGSGPETTSEVVLEIVDGHSTIGGGSAPQSAIPTRLVSIRSAARSAGEIESALRAQNPPVVARIQHDAVLLDLRTVAAEDDAYVAAAVTRALVGPARNDL
ncbi:MAG: L-seryl-tRNA(Sec) selenium transferase [Acidobacteria bacterium]|nr:L-seryl-tRNA(Sec) selenium transferase [Acidobacteriota bacterium]